MTMNEEQKQAYKERYLQAKQKGVKFWPDIMYKDLIFSFAIFLLLVGLATFIGVAREPRADPSDSSYIPRPEWYFLFLFKFLAIYGQIPILGKIEWIAAAVIPGIGVALLFALPFIDHNPFRHFSKRRFGIALMSLIVAWIVLLTILGGLAIPPNDVELRITSTLQAFVGLWIPAVSILALIIVAFINGKEGSNLSRNITVGIAGVSIASMAIITFIVTSRASYYPAPEEEQVAGSISEKIVLGQDLYSFYCAECHGPDGEGGEVKGVEGLEGVFINPISSQDVMWTRSDETLFRVTEFGQQDLGMPPFGLAYGGELKTNEIEYIVTFMRYTWDSRAEIPEDAAAAGAIPALAEGEIPSYEVHIQPIVKRYCISCHRPGKENNNYLMGTYAEIIETGDNAPNVIAGNLDSNLIVTIYHESIFDAAGNEIIGPMPPTKKIKPEYIEIFEKWVLAGMPETVDEATALQTESVPMEVETPAIEEETSP
jgi:quinol-cytochrome oxidoreductase complex cytochrome b subunit